jgi:16S rRNA (guanine966-N2)-methyltransferase
VKYRKDKGVRPTTSKVREALFDILGSLEGASFLDLFAGSGLVGIEAASRGASAVTFVDLSGKALSHIKESLSHINESLSCIKESLADTDGGLAGRDRGGLRLVKSESRRFLRRAEAPFDYIFIDPPYGAGLVHEVLLLIGDRGLLKPGGLAVVEHHHKTEVPREASGLERVRTAKYGETCLTFFRPKTPIPEYCRQIQQEN